MGAIVKAIAISKPILNLFKKGALALESMAGRDCMKKVNFDPSRLNIIINTGIYRDDHIIEPAAATLVQREIGANTVHKGKTHTFAFDLDNGACGVLTGIQLIDGYLQTGMDYGMVVAGDSNPRPGLEKGFDFEPVGGAILLESGEEDKGFVKFMTDTYLQYKEDFTAKVKFMSEGGGKKTHYLVIRQSKDYMKKCVDCSVKSLDKFLKETGLKKSDIDLVITSQTPKGLIDAFAKKTGLGKKVVDVSKNFGNIHTVGPLAALSEAMDDGRFKAAKNTLFLAVGSGITVCIALYKK